MRQEGTPRGLSPDGELEQITYFRAWRTVRQNGLLVLVQGKRSMNAAGMKEGTWPGASATRSQGLGFSRVEGVSRSARGPSLPAKDWKKEQCESNEAGGSRELQGLPGPRFAVPG